MRTRLHLESLDGRIVPDATPNDPPTPGPVETPPTEAPWTAEEIANLRAAVAQLEQWGNEAGNYFVQLTGFLSGQQTYIDWLEEQTTALANGQNPPANQPPVVPQKTATLQAFGQLVQQVRDVGNSVQNAVRLTQEASDLFAGADTASALSKTMSDDAARLLKAATDATDAAEQSRLLNAAINATEQSLYANSQAQQMKDLAQYKLNVLRKPHLDAVKAFLQDK